MTYHMLLTLMKSIGAPCSIVIVYYLDYCIEALSIIKRSHANDASGL